MKGKISLLAKAISIAIVLFLSVGNLSMGSITAYAEETEGVVTKWTDTGNAAESFAGGNGTEEDPYQIATAAQLALLASENETYKASGLHFKITSDIDLSAHEWVPIADFCGSLDGTGHSINGLRIGTEENLSITAPVYIGLFAKASGTIKNLTIDVEIYISGGEIYRAGAIAGWFTGTIDNCIAKGVMDVASSSTGQPMLGGLVGNAGDSAKVLNSGNYVNVTGAGKVLIGGVVGVQSNGENTPVIMNCYNVGALHGKNGSQPRVGGIVGQNNTTALKIYNCYNIGTVQVTGNTSEWNASYGNFAAKKASGWSDTQMLYGLDTAFVQAETGSNRTKCDGETDMTLDEMKAAAFVDVLNTNVKTLTDSGVTGLMSWKAGTDGTPIVTADSDESGKYWTDHAAEAFAGGTGTEADPYQIANAAQLALLAKDNEAYKTKYFKLTDNIDLKDYEWLPITSFSGYFDGNGKSITGLKIGTADAPSTDLTGKNVGLFGAMSGTVKNFTVNAAIYVSDTSNWEGTAIVAGNLSGTLDKCIAEGCINVARKQVHVGGLAGYAGVGSKIINCGNKASICASGDTEAGNNTRAGGIAGSLVIGASHKGNILVANCYNVGTITATGGHSPLAGGICGWVQNNSNNQETYQISIFNCYNAGEVAVNGYANVKGKVGNITPYEKGAINAKNLYGVTDSLSVGEYVSVVVTCTGQTDIALEEMKQESFAEALTIHADTLVGEGTCEKVLLGWESVEDSTPTLTDTLVEGELAGLRVTVNSSRLGTVIIKADEAGGENYVDVASSVLKKGSRIQLIITPTSGCEVTALKLNGELQTVSGNTITFILTEATEIEVVLDVVNTVDMASIYVKASATAEGDGTEEKPFQTLKEAKTKLSTVLSAQPNAKITIYLMDGTYILDETFELGQNESSLGRVIFKNYEGAEPVITSGHAIAGGSFTKVDGKEYYSYQLPDSAKVNNSYPMFRDLYVDGERAAIARTEDLTYKYSYENEVLASSKVTSCDNSLYVSQSALAGVSDQEISGVEIGQLIEWKSQIFHIGSRDASKVQSGEVNITIKQSEWDLFYQYDKSKRSLIGRTYWLQNHLSFLDEPGEFYYDQATGIIYYYPYKDQDMNTVDIEYATLDILVELNNAANITFDGINFTGTTANLITRDGLASQLGCSLYGMAGFGDCGENVPCAAIYGDYAEGIRIQNCVFEDLGGSALIFQYGTKDLQIIGNSMKDLAMAGVQIGVAQLSWNTNGVIGASEDVVINNNYVTNVGLLVYGAPGIAIKRCDNLEIMYNKIVHVPYSGIMAGWGFDISSDADANKNLVSAEIAYNYIEDYLYKINDGAAIYTNGANAAVTETALLNRIHDNYIRGGAHNKTYTGIYHDGSASNWHTYHNVVDDIKSNKGPMFFQDDVLKQASHNITAENNYTTTSHITQNGDKDKNGDARNIVLKNNTMVANRSLFGEEAIAIMNAAGLQNAYKYLEEPMEVELRIADNTMHYEVNKNQEGNTTMQIELTNNSSENNIFTLTVTDALPVGIDLVINGGNVVNVAAGETVIVNGEFVISNTDKIVDTDDYVVGLEVMDAEGRVTSYPRTFTIKTLSGNVAGEIPYGTPMVDGVLDEAYLEGAITFFGPVFHPDTYHETDIDGGYYLLWDEDYLYCYIIVNESTIMSRGTEWIQAQIDAGKQGSLWETDAVETYLKVSSIKSDNVKFAVDAFGIQRFGNNNISLEHHNLPYVTKFTYNGVIIENDIPATILAGQTATDAMGTEVTGYVIEMTLPIKLIDSIINSNDGVPSAGDIVEFYIQNNDYRGLKEDGSIYTVAQANEMSAYTLKAKEETNVLDNFEVNNVGEETSGVTIIAPTDGWVEGTNTFAVSGGDACVVAVKNADGSYSCVEATATDTTGVYQYTVNDMTAETEIVVALSGDANGDGKVSNADITKLRAACAGKATLDGIQTLLGDVNANGKVTNADITRLRAACVGKQALNW